ncbi:hypothetical protein L5515_013546 [Caenorhabditis briggsae]|uniref:Mos1 transposase HTH domain-containing protein n=1 Tax=Caenorhabditis briggsae TaxID=6238 RepID=A0AAE9EBT9_CAEBR|nr:hypothetical protein L5515_013546 [Caenorhabditis briggsae]
MTEKPSILENPKFLRSCILYESLRDWKYCKVYDVYADMCRRFNDNFMDYPEFEFWWLRFLAGNFDIDYDRNQDPKYRIITDMPIQIFGKICENLGEGYQEKYRFVFRHVCKSFRALADSWAQNFRSVSIESGYRDQISMFIDGGTRYYVEQNRALSDFLNILTYPDLKLYNIQIDSHLDKQFLERFVLKLESLKIKIHVENVHLEMEETEIQKRIAALYQVETIEKAHFKGSQFQIIQFLDEMIKNQAENPKFQHLRKLKILKMEFQCDSLFLRESTKIVQYLLRFPDLKYCRVTGKVTSFKKLKERIEQFGVRRADNNPDIFHYPIPKSADFLKIQIFKNGFEVERNPKST